MSEATAIRPAHALPRLRVGQWLAATIGVLLAFAMLGIGLALVADHRLSDQRHVVLDQVEPALLAALNLENALINQETGLRGYLLSGNLRSLQPYEKGVLGEAHAYQELERRDPLDNLMLAADLADVHARVQTWRREFVVATLHRSHRTQRGSLEPTSAGKKLFDAIRASLALVQSDISARLAASRQRLDSDASFSEIVLLLAAAIILASVIGAGFLLRRIIIRPLASLGRDAEQVAGGDFAREVSVTGAPVEIVELAREIDDMRRRIVRELSTVEVARGELEAQARELTRSNAELEQFAYVASHDLQEPLRKVASFCQALERRYHGQLDERADQYIDFAVDGAKRMQALINDLLAFSRVGRSGRKRELLDLNDVLADAQASLTHALEESDARVSSQPLPVVNGERALLVSLFQNLIANAVKFRGVEAPLVRLTVEREEDRWQFSCADNGIGVEAEYADRIFVIFQRLHTKEAYPGTGIGLAMCRKIVEYHGGRMWLDPEHRPGAQFRFTLPIAEENP